MDRLGQVELLAGGPWFSRDRGHERFGHRLGDAIQVCRADHVTHRPREARPSGVVPAGRFEPHDAAFIVHDLQPAADVQRRGLDDTAPVYHGEFRGAAAHVDIEHAAAGVMRDLRGARTVCGEHGLHAVAGRCADQLTRLGRERGDDPLGVAPADGLAGQDDDARLHPCRILPGSCVGVVDDAAESRGVDQLVVQVRGETDRRLVRHDPLDDDVAAGEVLADPAQVKPREGGLGARRADVDTDAAQPHVVLLPDRVALQRVRRIVIRVEVVIGNAGRMDQPPGGFAGSGRCHAVAASAS